MEAQRKHPGGRSILHEPCRYATAQSDTLTSSTLAYNLASSVPTINATQAVAAGGVGTGFGDGVDDADSAPDWQLSHFAPGVELGCEGGGELHHGRLEEPGWEAPSH